MGRTRKRYHMGSSRRGYKQNILYGRSSKQQLDWYWYTKDVSWESMGLLWTIVDRLWAKGKTPNEIFKALRRRGVRTYEIRNMLGDWSITNHFMVYVVGITAIKFDGELWHHIPLGSRDAIPAFRIEFRYTPHSLGQKLVFSEGKLYREVKLYEFKKHSHPMMNGTGYYDRVDMTPLKPFPNPMLTPIMHDIVENYIESEFESDRYYVSGWIKGTLRIREMLYDE